MAATQAAIVLALGGIIAGGSLTGWMFYGQDLVFAATNTLQALALWCVSGTVYGKLSNQ